MANQIPSYLRLHLEEPVVDELAADPQPLRGITAFCRSFEQATGWQLQLDKPGVAKGSQPAVAPRPPKNETAEPPNVALPAAQSLADAFGEVLQELESTRRELRCREAELAAGVPVARRKDEEEHLALRLEAILKGGAEAVGCQAAALYSLDDATTQLKMRAAWGLSPERLEAPARPLRGEVADLEALVGHAVVLEDTSVLPHWRVPEEFAAAVCVPVSSPTEPLGTLWVFSDRIRPFSDEQTNLIEIIAGRIASELQREVLLNECLSSKQLGQQLARASRWQLDRLPNVEPLLDAWQLAGTTHSSRVLESVFYDWFVPPDGAVAFSIGGGEGSMVESALTMASIQSLLRAHGDYAHSPTKLLTRVNESFWNTSAGGQFASLFYATLDPESGDLDYSGLGSFTAWQATDSSPKNLVHALPPLGTEPHLEPPRHRAQLDRGDTVVVVHGGRKTDRGSDASTPRYVDEMQTHRSGSADEIVAAIRGALLSDPDFSSTSDWAVVVAKRLS